MIYWSHLNDANPDSSRWKETRATWEESIACIDRPLEVASKLTDLTKSFTDSTIFLKTRPS